MKKLFYLAAVLFMASCGNEKSQTPTTATPSSSPVVENVDGNIPDSANSMDLNKPMPIDSSQLKDTMHR